MDYHCLLCQNLCHLSYCDKIKEEKDLFSHHWLCPSCGYDDPYALATKSSRGGWSLYDYGKQVRELILQAKIQGLWFYQCALKELILRSKYAVALAQSAEGIVAAPSSLWGRIRGRYDIAALLADALADVTQTSRWQLPLKAYWSSSKRARMDHRQSINLRSTKLCMGDNRYFLVVDDVITSGYTIARTASYFPDKHYKYLTFASAQMSRKDRREPNSSAACK